MSAWKTTQVNGAAQDRLPIDTLLASDLAMYAERRIPPEMVAEARIHRGSSDWIRASYGIRWEPARDVGGVVYPYFHPHDGHLVYVRVRRDHPEIDENCKPQNKYICPPQINLHLYFPPGARERLRDDPNTEVALVESEKAALAMTAWAKRVNWNLVALAMGGCQGWRSKRARSWLAPNGEWQRVAGPIDDLKYLNGRMIYICLDSNLATNFNVQWAQAELTVELEKAVRDCTVRVCDLAVWLKARTE
jgi:hypothetical protein